VTRAEVVRLFRQITLAFPTFRLPEDMAEEQVVFWHQYLKDVPYETALRVLSDHIATERFPPTIADFRSRSADLEAARRQREETEAYLTRLEEWKKRAAPPPADLRTKIIAMRQPDGDGA